MAGAFSKVVYPRGARTEIESLLEQAADGPIEFATDLEHEIQTDKAQVKVVPCTGCTRPIVVNTFYAPAWAKCASCSGQTKSAGTGQAVVVQAGRTDPEKAANLADCLINKQFAEASCPLCLEPMELKNVSHNPNYGPRHLLGYDKNGSAQYDTKTGETALLQCNHCKTVTTYSTTHTVVYRRQNEPKPSTGRASGWGELLGARS